MRIGMNTSVALLLGSMCFSSSALAQGAERAQRPALELRIVDEGFHVSGGESGAPCVILIGLERGLIALPGARILVNPLLILWDGRFDSDGEYRWQLPPQGPDPDEAILFYAQAVTATESLSEYRASNVVYAEFDGKSLSEMDEPTPVTQPVVSPGRSNRSGRPADWRSRNGTAVRAGLKSSATSSGC